MTLVRLAPLALVALLAASCGDKDKSSSPATTASTTTSAVSTGPSGGTPIPALPSSKGSQLLLGARDLYPLLAGSLSQYVPNQVRGTSVKVVQIAGTDSFWAGRNAGRRILVKLNLKGGKTPVLKAGQQVDFVGQLAKAPANDASSLGVKKSGQPLLQKQGAYVIVSVGDLSPH
jgi:hypothetical protein